MNDKKQRLSVAQVGTGAIVLALTAGVMFANVGKVTAWLSKNAALTNEPLYERSSAGPKGDFDGMTIDTR